MAEVDRRLAVPIWRRTEVVLRLVQVWRWKRNSRKRQSGAFGATPLQRLDDTVDRRPGRLVLPYPDDEPLGVAEPTIGVTVPRPVRGDLVLPEQRVRLGPVTGPMSCAAVPEASVDEDRDTQT